jgi:hypothetical protein
VASNRVHTPTIKYPLRIFLRRPRTSSHSFLPLPTHRSPTILLLRGRAHTSRTVSTRELISAAAPTVQVFGRFSLDYFNVAGKGSYGALEGVGFGPGGLSGSSITHNYSLASGVTKTFSSTLLADFRFGYFKYNPIASKARRRGDSHDFRRHPQRELPGSRHLRPPGGAGFF